ncbi:hypothetical protein GQS40_07815|uniref:Carbohydrate kinase PfkB domain-containing protein n=1 Tax=Leuconostoc lactis TaxID=1246 RepID=A0A6L7ACE2_LEULA|nr:hypothetical protein [Leuconostoc lactis]
MPKSLAADLDYITRLPILTLGETNRSTSQTLFPGGKGINVSRLLSHLGIDNTALGFLGGFTGEHLQATLNEPHLTLSSQLCLSGCQQDWDGLVCQGGGPLTSHVDHHTTNSRSKSGTASSHDCN